MKHPKRFSFAERRRNRLAPGWKRGGARQKRTCRLWVYRKKTKRNVWADLDCPRRRLTPVPKEDFTPLYCTSLTKVAE
jgi:hypothetical protein